MDTLDFIIKKFDLNLQTDSKMYWLPGTRDKTLTELFRELGFRKGAEIGVERGMFSKTLCTEIPELTLFAIDPWTAYKGYREHVSQDKLEGFYEETIQRMRGHDYRIFRAFSEEAHKYFRDGSLDFVYIDGNHSFLNVTQDIAFWEPKVKKGGIVSGHDFRRNSKNWTNDVKDVIPAYTHALNIKPYFVIDDKTSSPSWFWVKK